MSKLIPKSSRILLTAIVALIPFLTGCCIACDPKRPQSRSGLTLVWSDEFSSPDVSLPDPKKWTYDIGGKGWGNEELEYYTNRKENARIENGNLVITALKETYTGADGLTREYTSARLKTQGLFAQTYGRFEARIKIPEGQGMWPAFWMLGEDITSAGWPKCGEIDIMENVGKEPGTVHGSLHGPSTERPTSDLTSIFSPPAVRTSQATSICMPSSGNRRSFAFTSTRISTPLSTPHNGPRAANGCSTIHFLSF
jgi:beta-glucanase (GH16 family)